MEKVEAIGGIFFRAKDPAALAAWYHDNLGIDPVPQLEAAGIEIGRRDEMEGIGRFERIHDPEGNPIELWEPVSA